MEKRRIGQSDLWVQPFCLGGNVFGWTADEAASHRILDAYIDHGFEFVDTADVYSRWAPGHSGGESESILGRWFAASRKRNKIILATKVGMDMGEGRSGLKAAYIAQAVDASLKRLKCDHIDLYQAHIDDPGASLEETLQAFDKLIRQGKVRVLGASNYNADRLEQALEISAKNHWPRYECLQPHYNLAQRSRFEGPLAELCARHELGVIPYYALASGFLTGKYRTVSDAAKSVRGQGAVAALDARGRSILEALDTVAAQQNATPAQIALAWLMAKKPVTAPIASAVNLPQLTELMRSPAISLSPESMKLLDAAGAEQNQAPKE